MVRCSEFWFCAGFLSADGGRKAGASPDGGRKARANCFFCGGFASFRFFVGINITSLFQIKLWRFDLVYGTPVPSPHLPSLVISHQRHHHIISPIAATGSSRFPSAYKRFGTARPRRGFPAWILFCHVCRLLKLALGRVCEVVAKRSVESKLEVPICGGEALVPAGPRKQASTSDDTSTFLDWHVVSVG